MHCQCTPYSDVKSAHSHQYLSENIWCVMSTTSPHSCTGRSNYWFLLWLSGHWIDLLKSKLFFEWPELLSGFYLAFVQHWEPLKTLVFLGLIYLQVTVVLSGEPRPVWYKWNLKEWEFSLVYEDRSVAPQWSTLKKTPLRVYWFFWGWSDTGQLMTLTTKQRRVSPSSNRWDWLFKNATDRLVYPCSNGTLHCGCQLFYNYEACRRFHKTLPNLHM